MYIREIHAEKDLRVLRRLVRDNPLGPFTTVISSPSEYYSLVQASHIPFVLDIDDESSETELGILRGHLARANPQSKAIIEEATTKSTRILHRDVLVIFQSPVHHYIPPGFLTETKPKTQKVVPTWNYAAVQVYGKATIYVDSKSEETSAYLNSQITALTRHMEIGIMNYTGEGHRPEPWKVSDAPERYTELLKKAIIGVEIKVERMEGKFKMSQEEPAGDRAGVIEGLRALGTGTGRQVADLVGERQELKYGKQQI
ncbi:transcriptional regulator [Fusarium albosuccineum]|uniref:Transcriptional regulator n=1 Tax=Fusarium albosuccineum TaxID=1237068 RepID=A0A8H4L3M8_9HYPO|nr:transcriptional regulator [Fusarium albosuccineum]